MNEFQRWMVVMITQQCERTSRRRPVTQNSKMVNLVMYTFYHHHNINIF